MVSNAALEAEHERAFALEASQIYIETARKQTHTTNGKWVEFYVDHAIKNLMIGSHVGRIGV